MNVNWLNKSGISLLAKGFLEIYLAGNTHTLFNITKEKPELASYLLIYSTFTEIWSTFPLTEKQINLIKNSAEYGNRFAIMATDEEIKNLPVVVLENMRQVDYSEEKINYRPISEEDIAML